MARFVVEPRFRGTFGFGLWILFVTILVSFNVQSEPAPYDLLMVALVGGLAFGGLLRIHPGATSMLVLLALFAFSNILSAMLSFDFTRTLLYMGVTFYLGMSTILVMFLMVEDEERVLKIIWNAYIIAAVLGSLLAIAGVYHLMPGADVYAVGGRGRGLFKDPNVLGPFLVPPALYLFSQFETKSGWKSILPALLLPVIMFGVLISFSRGAWGNIAFAFAAYTGMRMFVAFFSPRRSGPGIGKILIAVVAAITIGTSLIAILADNTEVGQTLTNKAQIYRHYDDNRFGNQAKALARGLDNPIGVGPGLSEQALQMATHSLYMRALLENGWLGVTALIAFILLTVWRGAMLVLTLRAKTSFLIAYASYLGVLVNSVVIDTLHWRHFFLVLGLVWGGILADYARQRVLKHEAMLKSSAPWLMGGAQAGAGAR